jgi:hypothetical protein
MILRFFEGAWRRWFPPLPVEVTVHFYLVRTGEYHMPHLRHGGTLTGPGKLTDAGASQARNAAQAVQRRTCGDPVVVLNPEVRPNRVCYQQTAEIIAEELGAPTTPMWYFDVLGLIRNRLGNVDEFDRSKLFDLRRSKWRGLSREQRRQDENYLLRAVLVVDGSMLNRLLAAYPGPRVIGGDELGPPYGSVHEMMFVYNRKTGEIISRLFVPEVDSPTTH